MNQPKRQVRAALPAKTTKSGCPHAPQKTFSLMKTNPQEGELPKKMQKGLCTLVVRSEYQAEPPTLPLLRRYNNKTVKNHKHKPKKKCRNYRSKLCSEG
jgi:hypothetical protein